MQIRRLDGKYFSTHDGHCGRAIIAMSTSPASTSTGSWGKKKIGAKNVPIQMLRYGGKKNSQSCAGILARLPVEQDVLFTMKRPAKRTICSTMTAPAHEPYESTTTRPARCSFIVYSFRKLLVSSLPV